MPRIEHPIVDDAATVQWKGPLAGTDHTVIRVPDLDAAIAWYEQLLGLVVSERSSKRAYLASPVTGHIVLGLSEGGLGLDYLSFRARTPDAFQAIAAKLDNSDVRIAVSDSDTRPGVDQSLRLTLPTGHLFEVTQAELPAAAPVEGAYRPGSIDVRTSHSQLRTTDVKGLTDFLGLMGFRSSAFVATPNAEGFLLQFLRVNDYHHQLAILTGHAGTHHVALEVDEADFWKLLDNLTVTKFAAEYGPLRHHEGNMVSLYIRDPFGNRLELTGTMERVGFDYRPAPAAHEFWYHMNMWGPQPPETWQQEWMDV
ncbi:bleomycin resistance protein [Microbacterium sp. Leaf288]|uniref:VOC family protein n=1 Tax=Microbacterium sp. Leaf288 TaxID=1736323 RepID=UPI0006FCC0DF|nr:VOC family protein [Microbacterium sp. Leaf288]KQP69985.1 bleomycin resistance protein [Microbacterium sp. Leaf288]